MDIDSSVRLLDMFLAQAGSLDILPGKIDLAHSIADRVGMFAEGVD